MELKKLMRRAIMPTFVPAVLSLSCAALVACGGGGSTSVAGGSAASTGTVNVKVTDGPGDDYTHAWVTIKAIAFHTDPNVDWSATNATWQTYTLPSPVTVDLASLNNGSLDSLFQGLNLPVGTYHQIRFFLAGAETTLTTSAQDTSSSNGPLLWNDQVEYVANGSTSEAPLEIPYPGQGIKLNGTFAVSAGSTLNLAVDFDLEHSIVPFRHNAMRFFVLKPILRYFDLSQSGAIVGKVDTSSLCGGTITSSCAYNLVVKAELLDSSTGVNRHVDVHATTVRPDGTFIIYPLLASDPNTHATLSYDVLIRGRQMNTKLITGINVTAGTTPGSGATNLQTTGTIPLTVNSNEYTAQLNSALSPLTSGYVLFQQTLPGSGQVPYEVRFGLTDPFTGLLMSPMSLDNGDLEVASYNSGNALSFSDVTPNEGAGYYSVSANEALFDYYTRSTDTLLTPTTSGSETTFSLGTPTLDSGVANGTVSGSIVGLGSTTYDRGELVIAHVGTIATTYDISSQLGTSLIHFSLANLPAGSSANPQPAAYYYAYLRLWNSTDATPKEPKIVPYLGIIDLTESDTATIAIAAP